MTRCLHGVGCYNGEPIDTVGTDSFTNQVNGGCRARLCFTNHMQITSRLSRHPVSRVRVRRTLGKSFPGEYRGKARQGLRASRCVEGRRDPLLTRHERDWRGPPRGWRQTPGQRESRSSRSFGWRRRCVLSARREGLSSAGTGSARSRTRRARRAWSGRRGWGRRGGVLLRGEQRWLSGRVEGVRGVGGVHCAGGGECAER